MEGKKKRIKIRKLERKDYLQNPPFNPIGFSDRQRERETKQMKEKFKFYLIRLKNN